MHKGSPPRGGAPGFSILEVLIASAILGLVVSALVVLLSGSVQMDALNDELRQARVIAKEEIEDPQRHFYSNPPAGVADLPGLQLDRNPDLVPIYTGIPLNTTVSVVPLNIAIGLPGNLLPIPCAEVSASVAWTDNDGTPQNLVLRKLVTAIQ